jgi:hypothetical protein
VVGIGLPQQSVADAGHPLMERRNVGTVLPTEAILPCAPAALSYDFCQSSGLNDVLGFLQNPANLEQYLGTAKISAA